MMADTSHGLLGDTPERSYGDKLERYSHFMEAELRQLIAGLEIQDGDRVLDAGCGTGLVARWLAEQVGTGGSVVGVDLAHEHVKVATERNTTRDLPLRFMQGDITEPTFGAGTFDLVWALNTINHLRDPVAGLRTLADTLTNGGRLVLVQMLLLPEMTFAWDERLERAVSDACRAYYRDRYGLSPQDVTNQRNCYGWMLTAGLANVGVRTTAIERIPPLSDTDRDYYQHSVFESYWGEKIRPYLDEDDWQALERLTDPSSDGYALDRPDFHAIQTCTVMVGHIE